jgi:riboflavin synthase
LSVEAQGKGARIVIDAPDLVASVGLGDSVAINGACLTVTEIDSGQLSFDAIRETLDRTSLGDLVETSRVNLERAMRAGGRLDGHIVQGHVDGVGTVRSLVKKGDDVVLLVGCAPEISEQLVDKGSVTIDGVSLTVVRAHEDAFDVALIPHTLRETTLAGLEPGRHVNLEVDILGKYVKTYVERLLHLRGLVAPESPAARVSDEAR